MIENYAMGRRTFGSAKMAAFKSIGCFHLIHIKFLLSASTYRSKCLLTVLLKFILDWSLTGSSCI